MDTQVKRVHQSLGVWGLNSRERPKPPWVGVGYRSYEKLGKPQEGLGMAQVVEQTEKGVESWA